MPRLFRFVAAVLVLSFFCSATGFAQAQSAPASPVPQATSGAPGSSDTMAAGLLEGQALAEGHGTGGNLGTGLAVGVLTGFIGTGIGYFVIGPSPLSAEALQKSLGKSADYQLGVKTGWEDKTRSKKRSSFLVGGLLGTAAWVLVLTASRSN
jgi:hypothetical protein